MKNIFVGCFLVVILLASCKSLQVNSTEPLKDEDISYENTIARIIENNCLSCHSGRKPSADMSLESYAAVKHQSVKGDLLKRINDINNPMPKRGLMSRNLRATILKWAKNGYPEFSAYTTIEQPYNSNENMPTTQPKNINAVDIEEKGFDLLENMRGHWIGNLNIMGQQLDWFSFDYRPISPSHIHGIYEGGTMGNIFTSFFITNYNGKKTIMARNGGILNGIYRTSYFVLDQVKNTAGKKYYRLVDAHGGAAIMWMELTFTNDQLEFNSYTSRFGENGRPKIHMKFIGKRRHLSYSEKTVKQFVFPKNLIDPDFDKQLLVPSWGSDYSQVTSASYIFRDASKSLLELSVLAQDPYPINSLPHLAQLEVNIKQNELINQHDLIIYLSKKSMTDQNGKLIMENGYLKEEIFDSVCSFPDIRAGETKFNFTYLHPDEYYITVIADVNKDGYVSKGDIVSNSELVSVLPNSLEEIKIEDFK